MLKQNNYDVISNWVAVNEKLIDYDYLYIKSISWEYIIKKAMILKGVVIQKRC